MTALRAALTTLACALAALCLALLLSSCSTDKKSNGVGDAPVERRNVDNSAPLHILDFPDQFENVAMKCLGSNGVYASTRDAAPVIVVNDVNCPHK